MLAGEFCNYTADLEHHGIKGQKWGIRRFQNPDGTLTDEGRKRYYKASSKTKEGIDPISLSIVGGSYALTLASAGIHYYKGAKNKEDNFFYDKEGTPEKLNKLKKKSEETTLKQDLKACNPRGLLTRGRMNNCTFCTATMEMRRRGYDVQARSKGHGEGSEVWSKWFKNAEVTTIKPKNNPIFSSTAAKKDLKETLLKYPEGASGYIGVQWVQGGGHAFNWKVENNKVVLFDGQNGKNNCMHYLDFIRYNKSAGIKIARLDNLKPTAEVTVACMSKKSKGEEV